MQDYTREINSLENLKLEMIRHNMNIDDVQTQINQLKKERILKTHTGKITAPTDSCPYWRTKIKIASGKYRNIRCRTYDGLLEKLSEYYFKDRKLDEITVMDAWKEYTQYGMAGKSDSTIYNYNYRFNTYFAKKLSNIPVRKLTKKLLKDLFEEMIITHNLKWYQVKINRCVLSEMLNYCVDKEIIYLNPLTSFDELKINRNLCAPDTPPGDKSRCFSKSEYYNFKVAVKYRMQTNEKNLAYAAALIIANTGLRIGECVALKFSDVDFEKQCLRIHRMETYDPNHGVKVVEHGKKKSVHALRKIALIDEAIEAIKHCRMIQEKYGYYDDDFIFCGENGRLARYSVSGAIRRICNSINIVPCKSAHDLRRTVITLMYERMGHESIDAIRRFAGHASVKQTIAYIYGTDTTDEEDQKIRAALS